MGERYVLHGDMVGDWSLLMGESSSLTVCTQAEVAGWLMPDESTFGISDFVILSREGG